MSDIENRRRRARYRAAHRGTREMDWLLGRFIEARVAQMDEAELERVEGLLDLSDPELQGWLMGASPGIATGSSSNAPATPTAERPAPPADLADLIAEIRAFHGA